MKRALSICLALLLAGCFATRELTAFEADSSEKALIRWQRKGRSLLYDAVCARARDSSSISSAIQAKPMPLAEFRLGPANFFEASGRLARRGWVQPAADAPPSFSTWIWFLTAYQKLPHPGAPSLQSATMRVTSTRSGDKLKVLSVSNSKTGEVISAIFN